MNEKVTSITIGNITVNTSEHKFSNQSGMTESLQPKICEVISYMALNHPRLISRTEIIDVVWEGNHYVGEKALTNAIWQLRQCFKRLSPDQEMIETVRKSGYKLKIKPIIEYAEVEDSNHSKATTPTPLISVGVIFILSAIFVVGYFILSNNEATKNVKPEIISITTEPGREVFPATSPDGTMLAFKWLRQGFPSDLFIKDLTQPKSGYRQLTFDQSAETPPVWSNDNQYLYYERMNRQSLECHLIQLNVKTNELRPLVECPFRGFTQIDISPDGQFIAFRSRETPTGDTAVYLLNLLEESQVPERITCLQTCDFQDRDITFSPDGRKLAITRRVDRFHENIVVIDLETREEVVITQEFEDLVGLTWHPNGKQIVFGAQQAEHREGFIVALDDKVVHPLGVEGFSFPHFSAKGELYFHEREEKYQVSSMDLSQTKVPILKPVVLSNYSHKNPDYSDIADQLVYVSNESGHYELWLANQDGSNRVQLSDIKSDIIHPEWSHDGRSIVFITPKNNAHGEQLNIIDIESREIQIIETDFNSFGRPSWSLDDQKVLAAVFQPGNVNIFEFDRTTNESVQITPVNARYAKQMDFENLIYSKLDGTLWKRMLNEDKEILLLDKDEFGVKYIWDTTEKGLYFYHKEKQTYQIKFYDFEQKTSQPLFNLTWLSDDHYGELSVSDKYNLIFLTTTEFPQADIKVLKHPMIDH